MSSNEDRPVATPIRSVERGVSVDQDGKSNGKVQFKHKSGYTIFQQKHSFMISSYLLVWAIEPKMEVDTKSADEKYQGTFTALVGFAAFAAVAAGVLSNLPDPNQF